jgi:hypothetical protein
MMALDVTAQMAGLVWGTVVLMMLSAAGIVAAADWKVRSAFRFRPRREAARRALCAA